MWMRENFTTLSSVMERQVLKDVSYLYKTDLPISHGNQSGKENKQTNSVGQWWYVREWDSSQVKVN